MTKKPFPRPSFFSAHSAHSRTEKKTPGGKPGAIIKRKQSKCIVTEGVLTSQAENPCLHRSGCGKQEMLKGSMGHQAPQSPILAERGVRSFGQFEVSGIGRQSAVSVRGGGFSHRDLSKTAGLFLFRKRLAAKTLSMEVCHV